MANYLFSKDIVLDQEAFEAAIASFKGLSADLQSLQEDISAQLDILTEGYNTNAGRKFVTTCRETILKILKEQTDIVNHVSENLQSAKNEYDQVFAAYNAMNNKLQ